MTDQTINPTDLLDITALPRPLHVRMAREILDSGDFYQALSELEFRVERCEKTVEESKRARRADRIELRETCRALAANARPVIAELDRVRTRLNILRGRNVSQASRDRLAAA